MGALKVKSESTAEHRTSHNKCELYVLEMSCRDLIVRWWWRSIHTHILLTSCIETVTERERASPDPRSAMIARESRRVGLARAPSDAMARARRRAHARRESRGESRLSGLSALLRTDGEALSRAARESAGAVEPERVVLLSAPSHDLVQSSARTAVSCVAVTSW